MFSCEEVRPESVGVVRLGCSSSRVSLFFQDLKALHSGKKIKIFLKKYGDFNFLTLEISLFSFILVGGERQAGMFHGSCFNVDA
jgi:hypothetical protein